MQEYSARIVLRAPRNGNFNFASEKFLCVLPLLSPNMRHVWAQLLANLFLASLKAAIIEFGELDLPSGQRALCFVALTALLLGHRDRSSTGPPLPNCCATDQLITVLPLFPTTACCPYTSLHTHTLEIAVLLH